MRRMIFGVAFWLTACAQEPPQSIAPPVNEAPTGAQQAYFANRPTHLFRTVAAVCDGPGQTMVKPSANAVRCESLPDPEAAASIILQFNGTVSELPRLVTTFSGLETTAGYLVTADSYIRVPQRTGAARQIRLPDTRIAEELASILTTAGGRPL